MFMNLNVLSLVATQVLSTQQLYIPLSVFILCYLLLTLFTYIYFKNKVSEYLST